MDRSPSLPATLALVCAIAGLVLCTAVAATFLVSFGPAWLFRIVGDHGIDVYVIGVGFVGLPLSLLGVLLGFFTLHSAPPDSSNRSRARAALIVGTVSLGLLAVFLLLMGYWAGRALETMGSMD